MREDFDGNVQCDNLYDMIVELKQRLEELELEIKLLKEKH